jgi:multidrug efflux pump subunit AcrA (membrane-fusion protein)
VVTKRYANVGAMIQAGTSSQAMPVVQLSQNNLLRLILPVPESSVGRVRVGETVDVQSATLGRTFPGRVARLAEKVQSLHAHHGHRGRRPEPDTHADSRHVRRGELHIAESRGACRATRCRGSRSTDAARVYRGRAGVIHIVPVTLGLETDQNVEILSGLKEGDVVVAGRHAGLREGQAVQVK